MTPIQACEETKELWTELARIAREENKAVEKFKVTGPWEDYRHHCPCCEYVGYNYCLFCPMYVEWKAYSSPTELPLPKNGSRHATCEDPRSPYRQWTNIVYLGALCIDTEFFCLLIVEMAEEAIERHIDESQPSLAEDKDIEYF